MVSCLRKELNQAEIVGGNVKMKMGTERKFVHSRYFMKSENILFKK